MEALVVDWLFNVPGNNYSVMLGHNMVSVDFKSKPIALLSYTLSHDTSKIWENNEVFIYTGFI